MLMPLCGTCFFQFATVPTTVYCLRPSCFSDAWYQPRPEGRVTPLAITECHHSVVPVNTAPPEGHSAAIHADYVDHASSRYVTCKHWLKAGGFRCPGLDIILPKAYLARYPPKVLRDSLAWCTDLTINPDREIKRFPWLTLVDLNHAIGCFLERNIQGKDI